MPYYEMRLNITEKISDLALSVVGRRPVAVGEGGRGFIIHVEFNPDLTPAERTALLNAMPEWVRLLFDFSIKSGSLIPPAP